jgi:hypothetical protein
LPDKRRVPRYARYFTTLSTWAAFPIERLREPIRISDKKRSAEDEKPEVIDVKR